MKVLQHCQVAATFLFVTAVCMGQDSSVLPVTQKGTVPPPKPGSAPLAGQTGIKGCQPTGSCSDHARACCEKPDRRLSLCNCRHNWQLICDWLSYRPENAESPCTCLRDNYAPGCHPQLYLYFLYNCALGNGCGAGPNPCPPNPLTPTDPSIAKASGAAPAGATDARTGKARQPSKDEPAAGTALVIWQEDHANGGDPTAPKSSSCWFNRFGVMGIFSKGCGSNASNSDSTLDSER
jgi:hypothetical protein